VCGVYFPVFVWGWFLLLMMGKWQVFNKKLSFSLKVFFILSQVLFFSQSNAGENSIEYKIKAGYLYNFTKFITWPENETETFNICILGHDPFGSVIDPIEKRTVKKKPIRLFRIKAADEAKDCHIVYLSSSSRAQLNLPRLLTITTISPLLTVGEEKQFVQRKGMISFFQRDGKVKLHINLKTLRESGLDVSAKLLEIADIYQGESDD